MPRYDRYHHTFLPFISYAFLEPIRSLQAWHNNDMVTVVEWNEIRGKAWWSTGLMKLWQTIHTSHIWGGAASRANRNKHRSEGSIPDGFDDGVGRGVECAHVFQYMTNFPPFSFSLFISGPLRSIIPTFTSYDSHPSLIVTQGSHFVFRNRIGLPLWYEPHGHEHTAQVSQRKEPDCAPELDL